MENRNNEERRSNELVPKQLMDKDFRFAKIPKFEVIDGKKKLNQEKGKTPYRLSELQGWIENGNHVGIWGWYGKLGIVDLDHPNKETRHAMLKAIINQCGKTWIVKTCSGKEHIYYYVDRESHPVMKIDGDENGKTAWEIRSKHDKFTLVPINNNGLYNTFYDHDIATTRLDQILHALKPWTWDKKENRKDINAELVSGKTSPKYFDINEKLSFNEFLSHYGMTVKTFSCPKCKNISSEGKLKPALQYYNDHISCFRCGDGKKAKRWDMWSMLEYAGCVDKKEQLKTLYEIAGIEWHELPPETGFDDAWISPSTGMIEQHLEATGQKDKKNDDEKYTMNLIWNGETYRQRTDIDTREYWVYPVLPKGGSLMLGGNKGGGKSWCSMGTSYAATSKANFGRWRGYGEHVIDRVPRLLYLDGEMGKCDFGAMIHLFKMNENFIPYPYRDLLNEDKTASLGVKEYRDKVMDTCIKEKIDIVVFDNVFSLFTGIGMMNMDDWGEANDWLLNFRNHEISIIVVDHMGKDATKGIIGSTGKIINIPDVIHITTPNNHRKQRKLFMKAEVDYEYFRSGGSLEDAEKVLCEFTVSLPRNSEDVSDFIFEFADDRLPQEMTVGSKRMRDTEYINYSALGMVIENPDIRQLDIKERLNLSKNEKVFDQLAKEGFMVKHSNKNYTVSEVGKKWYHHMKELSDLEIEKELGIIIDENGEEYSGKTDRENVENDIFGEVYLECL